MNSSNLKDYVFKKFREKHPCAASPDLAAIESAFRTIQVMVCDSRAQQIMLLFSFASYLILAEPSLKVMGSRVTLWFNYFFLCVVHVTAKRKR